MAKQLDSASQKALAQLDAYDGGRGPEPDWESGTQGTLRHFVLESARLEGIKLSDTILERTADEVYRARRAEQGMASQIDDLGYQPWLAESISISMRHALKASPLNSAKSNRKLLINQIDTLCLALQENLDAVDKQKNHPPTLDLALDENPTFLREVRRLNELLQETKKALTQRARAKTPTIARRALDQFVTSLASSTGEGLGRTVTLTSRMILVLLAMTILKEIGAPSPLDLSSIKALLPE